MSETRRYRPYPNAPSRSTPQPSEPSHSPRPLPSSTEITPDADRIATQTVAYLDQLAEHSTSIKQYPGSEGVYERVIQQKRVAPVGTKLPLDPDKREKLRHKMLAIIRQPSTTAEE